MGKQGRTAMRRMAAVGAGVVLAGSIWTGTAAAQSSSPAPGGGPQCSLLPLLAAQIQQLSSAGGAAPLQLPGVPTNLGDAITQFNSLIPGCTAQGPNFAGGQAAQPFRPEAGPRTPDFCPDDHDGRRHHGRDHGHGGDSGTGGDTMTPPTSPAASSSGAPDSNPAGMIPVPGLSGTGATDSATGQTAGAPGPMNAAAPAAIPGLGDTAAPQQQAYAGPQQQTNTGYQPVGSQGSGDQFASAPYGNYPAFDGSYNSGFGNTFGYGWGGQGYTYNPNDRPDFCPSNDDHRDNKDFGQVNHVPEGSVNTGDGSTVVDGRTTG